MRLASMPQSACPPAGAQRMSQSGPLVAPHSAGAAPANHGSVPSPAQPASLQRGEGTPESAVSDRHALEPKAEATEEGESTRAGVTQAEIASGAYLNLLRPFLGKQWAQEHNWECSNCDSVVEDDATVCVFCNTLLHHSCAGVAADTEWACDVCMQEATEAMLARRNGADMLSCLRCNSGGSLQQ